MSDTRTVRPRRHRLRPGRRKGRRAGGLLRQARRGRREIRDRGRRLRPHRHAAVEDAARDRALPDRLSAARAVRHDARHRSPGQPAPADGPPADGHRRTGRSDSRNLERHHVTVDPRRGRLRDAHTKSSSATRPAPRCAGSSARRGPHRHRQLAAAAGRRAVRRSRTSTTPTRSSISTASPTRSRSSAAASSAASTPASSPRSARRSRSSKGATRSWAFSTARCPKGCASASSAKAIRSVSATPSARSSAFPAAPSASGSRAAAELQRRQGPVFAGRAGNTRGLGLDRAGVTMDAKGRILVNEHFQTSRRTCLRRRRRHRLPGAGVGLDGAGARRDVPRLRSRVQDQGVGPHAVRRLHDPRDLDDRRDRGSAEARGHPLRGRPRAP